MESIQPYLVLGLLGTYVSSACLIFTIFTIWIFSLKSKLEVYAHLVDGMRKRLPPRYERKTASLSWPKVGPDNEAHFALKMQLLPAKSNNA